VSIYELNTTIFSKISLFARLFKQASERGIAANCGSFCQAALALFAIIIAAEGNNRKVLFDGLARKGKNLSYKY
jgi:hypothetical protein